jgi:pilus assembly protein Flp/PilA
MGGGRAATGAPAPVAVNVSLEGSSMHALINNFLKDESGPTMVEYGLLVALIALVVGAAALVLGTQLSTMFSKIAGYISSVSVPSAP